MEPMETPMDRNGFEIMTPEECWTQLSRLPVGRIAFISAGSPVILPVNYALDGHAVIIRSAVGEKLHAASVGQPVAFEVDAWEDRHRSGWSVLVQGVAEEVEDGATIERFEGLGLRPWADSVARDRWIRIRPDEISGRRLAR
jgi:nitroimidazol reductase NimA-like FMN-containing flavoprotein (pyridoxamine 5'-phosphate oxidase superfamily)